MSEKELRDGLRDAVADEPPLAFDPDALMERARKEVKRRRALFGAGLATAAVAVAAVAVPTMLGSPRFGAATGGARPESMTACGEASAVPPVEPPVEPPVAPSDFPIPSGPPGVSYKVVVPSPGTAYAMPLSDEPAPPSAIPTGTPTPIPLPSDPPAVPEPCPSSDSTPPSATPPSATPPPPVSSAPATAYTADELRKRGAAMAAHLAKAFPALVPAATNVKVDAFGGEAAGAVSDGQRYLDTFVHYSVKGKRTAVDVAVYAPGAGPSPDSECGSNPCSAAEGPGGTRLLTTRIAVGAGKATIVSVLHFRVDGSVVRVSGYDYDPTASTPFTPLGAMPVDEKQLTQLATDPELSL